MIEHHRTMKRLERAMPSGMAFFGFLLILFGILGVLTTASEISERNNSADTRSQAAEPPAQPPNPPAGCWYTLTSCAEPDCVQTYQLNCPPVPVPVAPARLDGKIIWETPDVAMRADALTISLADGRVFTTTNIDVQIGSDPVSTNNPNYTTLEGIWYEQDVEMRLYLYLRRNPQQNIWYAEELRVYNGNNPGDWITFTQSNSPYRISTAYGSPFSRPGTMTMTSSEPVDAATLSFTNLSLSAFLRKAPYCAELGQRPADVSGDEHVDILDLSALTSKFFETGELDTDLNCDEVVDLHDYTLLINQLQL